MDRVVLFEKAKDAVKKYRYVLLVLLAGLILMWLPVKTPAEPAENITETKSIPDLQSQLQEILSQIQGAGRVRVLLTEDSGEEILYQSDEQTNISEGGSDIRVETVLVTDTDRAQQGLVRRVEAPSYRGAVVVCQGADSPAVRLAVVEAVANATGLGTDRITVLKMK